MGLLVFLSEAKKLNLLNRLAAGWLVFETELKELMHRCGSDNGQMVFQGQKQVEFVVKY